MRQTADPNSGSIVIETSQNLLSAAKALDDTDAWQRLVSLYAPLLYGWLRRQNIQHVDCEDLVQDTFVAAAKKLPDFCHNGRNGAFRCWLRTVLANRLRTFQRERQVRSRTAPNSDLMERIGEQLADPHSDLSHLFDGDHDRFMLRRCLDAIRDEFAEQTWAAFSRTAIEGLEPEEVASELGVALTAVYNAKFRVLKRLRQVAVEFLI